MTRQIHERDKEHQVIQLLRHIFGADEPNSPRRREFLEAFNAAKHRIQTKAPSGAPSGAPTGVLAAPDLRPPAHHRFEILRKLVVGFCPKPAQCQQRRCRRTGRCQVLDGVDTLKPVAEDAPVAYSAATRGDHGPIGRPPPSHNTPRVAPSRRRLRKTEPPRSQP